MGGDSMDNKDNLLLTVSSEQLDQIQLFDIRKKSKISTFQMIIDENGNPDDQDNRSCLFGCKFNPVNETFCVAGSNKNILRVYDYSKVDLDKEEKDDNKNNGQKLNKVFDVSDLQTACYCCDYTKNGKKLAYFDGYKVKVQNVLK